MGGGGGAEFGARGGDGEVGVGLGGVGGVEGRGFEVVLRDAGGRMRVQDFGPADVGVEEAPPHPVFADFSHASASVEESGEHALPQFDDPLVLLRFRRLGGIVGYTVLLGDRRDDQRRVQIDQRLAQTRELGVPSPHHDLAGLDGVGDVAPPALGVFAGVHDVDFEVWVLVEDLLDAAVVAAFFGGEFGGAGLGVVRVGEGFGAQVGGAGDEGWGLVGGGVARGWGRGAVECWRV